MRDARLVALRAVASAVFIGTGCTSGSTIASEGAPQASTSVLVDAEVTLVARLLEVADTRRLDTVFVDQALSSRVSYVRALGVRVIGQNAIAARARILPTLMFDADTAVAAEAAFALGQLRYEASLAHLANALVQSPSVAAAAAWSLGEIGGTGGRRILEHVLTTGEPRPALVAVLESAAKLRPVPSQLITPYLADSDAAVQRAAAYAVTRSRVPGSVRALIDFANRAYRPADVAEDRAIDLWSYVGRGLGQLAAGDSLAQAARSVLVRLAVDPHPHVRINALRALATYGRDARAFLLTRGRDPDANTRIAWAQALGDVAGHSADDWMFAWQVDTGFTFRRSLLTPALRAGVRLPALDGVTPGQWTRHASWRYRAAVAQAAVAGSAADIDALAVPLLHDSDARVRSAAWASALAWADSAAALGKPYARAAVAVPLGDTDLFVRASVLDAIRGRARAPDAAIAVRAWSRASRDPENDARVAALRVIGAAWRNDSVAFSRALRDSLAATVPPTDPIERAIGRGVAPLGHWPHAGPLPRPSSWYLAAVRSFVLPDLAGRPIRATILTSRGPIQIRFYGADAPLTVANFVSLARRGYYNGLSFHRVVPNFVAQDGDPRGDGSGGPGYAIRDELNRRWYDRGTLGMALSGPDTGGSQYFMAHSPQPHLDGHYTVFGHITDGFDALDAVVQGDAIVSVVIR